MRTKTTTLFLAATLVGLAPACVEKSKGLTAAQREQLKGYISKTAPKPQHPLAISFEERVELVGYDLSKDLWQRGKPLKITWHWKCSRALDGGWRLFTHVADIRGHDRLNRDNEGMVRTLYPPGKWKVGEYIRDVQEITLPDDWDSPRAVFYLGVWKDIHRLQVTEGPSDAHNRARALSMPTNASASNDRPLPTIEAHRASGDITIDGDPSEAAWQQATATQPFVHTMTGQQAAPTSRVRLLWNEDQLFVTFDVEDSLLKSRFTKRDEHLWEQDAVEVMIDPEGDGRNYFELQVAPTGNVFDTHYDTVRQPRPFGHVDWDSKVAAAVKTRGTPNDGKKDKGYTVEMAIPWSALTHGSGGALKPAEGDTWRMNFYVLDAQEEGQRGVGWSPPRIGDFHVPARFGRVRFR